MADEHPTRIDAVLVAGGKYHDIDFARLQLLNLLAEHPHVRVQVTSDWENTALFDHASIVVSYTCDVRPSEAAQRKLRSWVEGGGRWLALHGTNAALDLGGPNGVDAPRIFPLWAETLGSQFIAHPPIQPYRVGVANDVSATNAWLVSGLEAFDTDDELYLSEYHARDQLQPLLSTEWTGDAKGFVEHDWTSSDPTHLVSYVRTLGSGAILYNTLGHCRGHWDMVPRLAYYPRIERCSWDVPQYHELLRRGIRWTLGHSA
jgi:uncharacterized protein